MTSHTTKRFRQLFADLPPEIQASARKAYRLWRKNPRHPGLRFKQVHNEQPVFSVRITQACRALGVKSENTMIWFWIGPHDDYEAMIARL